MLSLKLFSQNMPKPDTALINKYIKAGVPSLSRDWAPQDYAKAVETLSALKTKNKLKLPVHNSGSRLIFEKITGENYRFIEAPNLNTVQKMNLLAQMIKPISQLMKMYVGEGFLKNEKLKCSHEVTVCMMTLLTVSGKLMQLADQYAAETGQMDKAQQEGFDQMRNGFATSIAGIFQTLEKELNYYERADMCLLADKFFKFYDNGRNSIDAMARQEFDARRSKVAKENPLDCVKQAAR